MKMRSWFYLVGRLFQDGSSCDHKICRSETDALKLGEKVARENRGWPGAVVFKAHKVVTYNPPPVPPPPPEIEVADVEVKD
jgi:hypothetical protein